MQSTSTADPSPIIVAREVLLRYLPEEWDARQKEGFLLWLCGRAGVMVDDAEDNIWFAHLSFQEFLTAWHLNNNDVGEAAEQRFEELSANSLWWETLLLWAALLNDQSSERAEKLLQTVLEKGPCLLAGMMLADGSGTEAQMEVWAGQFARLLCQEWPQEIERCLRVWQASRQEKRREVLIASLRGIGAEAHWMAWLRIEQALEGLGSQRTIAVPRPDSAAQAPIAALYMAEQGNVATTSAKQFAGARTLSSISLLWPGYLESLLHLWPSQRRRLTLNLQRLASMNVERDQLLNYLIRYQSYRALPHAFPRALVRALVRIHVRALAHELPHDLPRDLFYDLNLHHIRHRVLVPVLVRALERDLPHDLPHDLNLDQALDLAHALDHPRALDRARALVRVIACDRDLINVSALFSKTASLRASLCGISFSPSVVWPDTLLPLGLLSYAAYASVMREPTFTKLDAAIASAEQRGIDPFWIAFARHIARRSTPEDQALLTDLAAHPEKREPPLSWGLQYIVRGDILLPDDIEVTLDELCNEAGVPPYPLLEEMPPEIEFDTKKA